ncbi:hypothetical protein HK097_003473 [Rhizophlyctis rosea]|uniref:Inner centromere protein ARK-binding domain-containing protein n=1 Tax=Rhizophlyctis rosea TaxID=64517 RepID=A0AAD5X018_9FUNG|nr:hypothetical protein HK097_003473 [Rhizophlyctis rosea]
MARAKAGKGKAAGGGTSKGKAKLMNAPFHVNGWAADTRKQQLLLFDNALRDGEAEISNHLHFLHTQWLNIIESQFQKSENYTKIFKTPGKRKRPREDVKPPSNPLQQQEAGLFKTKVRAGSPAALEFSEPTSTARALKKASAFTQPIVDIPENETARLSLEHVRRSQEGMLDGTQNAIPPASPPSAELPGKTTPPSVNMSPEVSKPGKQNRSSDNSSQSDGSPPESTPQSSDAVEDDQHSKRRKLKHQQSPTQAATDADSDKPEAKRKQPVRGKAEMPKAEKPTQGRNLRSGKAKQVEDATAEETHDARSEHAAGSGGVEAVSEQQSTLTSSTEGIQQKKGQDAAGNENDDDDMELVSEGGDDGGAGLEQDDDSYVDLSPQKVGAIKKTVEPDHSPGSDGTDQSSSKQMMTSLAGNNTSAGNQCRQAPRKPASPSPFKERPRPITKQHPPSPSLPPVQKPTTSTSPSSGNHRRTSEPSSTIPVTEVTHSEPPTVPARPASTGSATTSAAPTRSMPAGGHMKAFISLIEQERVQRERDLQNQITRNPAYLKAKEALERARSANGGASVIVPTPSKQGDEVTKSSKDDQNVTKDSERTRDVPEGKRTAAQASEVEDVTGDKEELPILSQGTDARDSWHDAREFRASGGGNACMTEDASKTRRSTLSRMASVNSDYADASQMDLEQSILSDESETEDHMEQAGERRQADVQITPDDPLANRKDREELVEEGDEEKQLKDVEERTNVTAEENEEKKESIAAPPASGRSLWGGGLLGALASTTRSIANLSTQSTFIPTVVKDKPAAPKPKVEIKALQAAAQAARKEQEERERRAQQRQAQAERTKTALKRKEEEDQRRAEELRKKEEEKNKRVEGLLAQKRQDEELAKKKRADKMREMAERQQQAAAEAERKTKEEQTTKIAAIPKSKIPAAPNKAPANEWEEIMPKTPATSAKQKPIIPVSILKTPSQSSLVSSSEAAGEDFPAVKDPILSELFETPDHQHEYSGGEPSTAGSQCGYSGNGKKRNRSEGVTTLALDEHGNLPEPPSDYSSDSDITDSDEDKSPLPKKRRTNIPAWADSPEVRKAQRAMRMRDPDALFGQKERMPPIEEVFKEGLRNKKAFRARQSSAFTGADKLTEEEIEEFKRKQGYKY